MPSISQGEMIGIISAQNSIGLAAQNQGLANQTYRHGRILERQGVTDGNQDAVEKGQEMQERGKEMQASTFEHLGEAAESLQDIERIDAEGQTYYGSADHELDVAIGDSIEGSINMEVSVPRQSLIDVAV
ncbi:MAG: hypothetical protein FWE20_12510 [Defluviitaleaceae bacterium]|nr:hypothetical protein [Defluviitaleaceae bacterium]